MGPVRVETTGDEHFCFIKDLKAEKTLFGGTYRIHDRNATVISHLGNEFAPLFSTRNTVLGVDECILIALQKDGELPGLTCFVGTEGRSGQGFLNMAIMILWFCREESSQCVLALERSPWAIATGDTPSPRFIRDFTTTLPAIGCPFTAIFPHRDGSARSKSRLVSYVASSQVSFQFIEFPSFYAYKLWLRECAPDLRAQDMSRLCLFTSKEEPIANLRLRFESLEEDFPDDAAFVAQKLGNPEFRHMKSRCSAREHRAYRQFSLVNDRALCDWGFDTDDALRRCKSFGYREETVHGGLSVVTGAPCAPPLAHLGSPRPRIRKAQLGTIEEECGGAWGDGDGDGDGGWDEWRMEDGCGFAADAEQSDDAG